MTRPAATLATAPDLDATAPIEVERLRAMASRWQLPVGLIDELARELGLETAHSATWVDGDDDADAEIALVESTPSFTPSRVATAPGGSTASRAATSEHSTTSARATLVDTLDAPPASAPPEVAATTEAPAHRYEDLGMIGLGGMGEVRRVRDKQLGRTVAMKIIRTEYKAHPRALSRFLEEAQVSAQLAHPNIVPVHDIGRLDDGRYFFTMEEIRGRNLSDVVRELHRASPHERWGTTADGWTIRRLIEAFRRVCDAIAYAHARGVLHRDLKPDNIMLGAFGEVLVMDWGLAKLRPETDTELEPVLLLDDDLGHTRLGTVAGTPAYMPPEQARGELDKLGPRSDVYALGAILYEVLDGASPYPGKGALERVLKGPPRPLDERAKGRRKQPGPSIARPLRAICARAMARDAQDRYPDAGAMGAALSDFLEGARRREQALALVARADTLEPEVRRLRAQAAALRRRASTLLDELPPGAEADDKQEAWDLQDDAEALEMEAELKNVDVLQDLRAALTEAPDTAEAHERLAAHYQARHADAEARRDARGQAALEALVRAHDTGSWSDYLAGQGVLSLRTNRAARVRLLRYEVWGRRLIARPHRDLGTTPLRELRLDHGAWVLELERPGKPVVRYPVHLGRQEVWSGTPPEADAPNVVRLPDDLGTHDIYVPGAWAWTGGDRAAPGAAHRARVWVDSFVMRKHPVTHNEYLGFLEALIARGQHVEALRYAPRLAGLDTTGTEGLRYGWADGAFVMGPELDPDGPVTYVDWQSARAFAAWESERTRQRWRLPTELEWEKAARGVDGRFFPWGDFFDPAFCRVRAIHRTARSPDPVHAWPVDESPYGVRGMSGNCRDWCLDAYRPGGPLVEGQRAVVLDEPYADVRSVRGGCWTRDDRHARLAARDWEAPETRGHDLGFRLVRSVP